jgi:hypothetical protein
MNNGALWISSWVLIVVFLILAAVCRSILLIVLVTTIALAMVMSQCLFSSSQPQPHTTEFPFGTGTGTGTAAENVGYPNMEAPELHPHGPGPGPGATNTGAAPCANRTPGSGDWDDPQNAGGWVTGYEGPAPPPPRCDQEDMLEKLAVDTMQSVAAGAGTEARLLPEKCSTAPLPCSLRVGWQPSFVGCSTTFIEAPSCNLYKKDDRLWNRRLDDIVQERSVQSGEIWDVYKHFSSRQKFAQFLSEDMVNRKGFYERPIENLEEAACFRQRARS